MFKQAAARNDETVIICLAELCSGSVRQGGDRFQSRPSIVGVMCQCQNDQNVICYNLARRELVV